MPTIVFSKSVSLPIAPLREMLTKHLPLYTWRIGERDTGGDKQMGEFEPHQLIAGRSPSTVIFTELTAHQEQLRTPAPPHQWHLQVGTPTTELQPIADRVTLVVCAISMILDEHFARCQLKPGGPWLSAEDLARVLKLVNSGETIDIADGLGIPAAHFGGAPESRRVESSPANPALAAIAAVPLAAPPLPPQAIGFAAPSLNDRVLPPLVLLLDDSFTPDWDHALQVAQIVDRDGDWSMQVNGNEAVFEGRDTRIMAVLRPSKVPHAQVNDALGRSRWLPNDPAALAGHSRHLSVGCPLDTGETDYETVRQVATAITGIFGALGRGAGVVALHNSGTGTLFAPSDAGPFVADLGSHELPVHLWVYTCAHDLTDGNICLSTSGLFPFLGHELEVWNAPITRDEASERVMQTIIYLLQRGPVIGHGDVAGKTRGDRSIRCFKGPSRVDRAVPVEALFLEFAGEQDEVEAPRPDVDPYSPPPANDPLAALLAGRAGPTIAPEAADYMLSQIAALRAGSTPEEHAALDELEKLVRNPPPRTVIESDDNPIAKAMMTIAKGVADRNTPPPTQPQWPPVARRPGGFGRKGL